MNEKELEKLEEKHFNEVKFREKEAGQLGLIIGFVVGLFFAITLCVLFGQCR